MPQNSPFSATGTLTSASGFVSVVFTTAPFTGLAYFDVTGAGSVSIQVNNQDAANAVTYQILASNDRAIPVAQWAVKTAATDVLAVASGLTEFDASARFLAVQVKDKVGGSHALCEVAINHQRILG